MSDPAAAPAAPATLRERFAAGQTFAAFLASVQKNRELWEGVYRHARVPDMLIGRARALPGRWKLLVLNEDWCGDAANSVPLLARLSETAPAVELRLIGRDANDDLMATHLTGQSRSIPLAMILDERHVERGRWGPRPEPLQRWVLGPGLSLPKEERYREVRTWYARDRGVTMLTEVITRLEGLAPRGGE